MSNAVAVINDAVNSMTAGETRVLYIYATYIGSMRRKSQLPGATPRKPTAFKDLATVSGTTG